MKKRRTKFLILLPLLMAFSFSAKAIFYWTIVDPAKTGTIIQRITQAAMEHAQRLAFFEMEQQLRIALSNRFVSDSAAQSANSIARETQVETDIQNRTMDAKTDSNPHVCEHLSASEAILAAKSSDKQFTIEASTRINNIYSNNSAQTDMGLSVLSRETGDILEPNSDEYSPNISEEYGVLLAGIKPENQFTKLDYSGSSNTSKIKHLNSLRQRTLSQNSALRMAQMHQQLNDTNSHFNQFSSSLKDGFGADSSTTLLEYTLNKSAGAENSSALHGLLSELALSKAKQLSADFLEYENSLKQEAELATQLLHLKEIYN